MTGTDALELSCGLPPGPDFADLAVLAEELGYARVWIFDSAPLYEDPFAHLALAAVRTSRVGLGTAVLIPAQRSVMTTASAIATIARLSGGRFRACFGTGYTASMTIGQPPMSLDAMIDYVGSLRGLLAGETVSLDGRAARMLHWPGLAAERPIQVPLWLSVFGPRGNRRAPEVADGTFGPPHPTLPTATMVSGTVLDPGEDRRSSRVLEALGPWRVAPWHSAYAFAGAAGVDALPGGQRWREALEELAPADERHLLTFEGHVTHLTERDRSLLEHLDTDRMVGDPETVRHGLDQLAEAGFREAMYTPAGPDVARELRAFAAAHPAA
ncbi:LLM class flavin-dependent oxidoreductase [Frankia sp. CNm7]|uniref:LLM class flavin-dependent oxidoreductase n=1 Tax=Frankia nepalensis TaxID=1836974 RepID=A0A937REQ4_9ACTN|nr:LLM class flavin-dependent oxidoreductase [Frankia nepalensis]MBL7496511.1 LLM class flavin-dependent oxidoreductase [Frankia nepalensis]MBL7511346.1 LLM class flavin-dependent oxidoreductase [Frankia nepalensis]MBL7521150.1 LLM class flavin-dependent oxidoreductase [Frankia nepalensis]MBL7627484.1 LLM class flavin-dependent oxidoreductase [Frankia nepalensis]